MNALEFLYTLLISCHVKACDQKNTVFYTSIRGLVQWIYAKNGPEMKLEYIREFFQYAYKWRHLIVSIKEQDLLWGYNHPGQTAF